MRSGYSDDIDQKDLAMWRGRVASAMRGKRGQKLLRDTLAALDAMPVKRLIPHELIDGHEVCMLGAVGKFRGVPLDGVDPEAHDLLAEKFDVSACLIQEIEYINDEANFVSETPEHRFERVRKWIVENIKQSEQAA